MAKQMYQIDLISPKSSISNGDTVTGKWMDIGDAESTMSIFLIEDSGTSTSFTVVYEVGYTKQGAPTVWNIKDDSTATFIQEVTPDDTGAITELTTADPSTAPIHDVFTPPPVRWIRFKVTCNNNSGVISLKAVFQR